MLMFILAQNPSLPIILLRVTPSANRNTYCIATLIIHIPRVEALRTSTLGYEIATPSELPGVRTIPLWTNYISPLATCHTSYTTYLFPLATCHTPYTTYIFPLGMYHTPYTTHIFPLATCHSPYTTHIFPLDTYHTHHITSNECGDYHLLSPY